MDALTFNPDSINWGADWWKLLLMAFAVLLLIYSSIRLALYVLRMLGVTICLAIGGTGAYVAQAYNTQVAERLPQEMAQYIPVLTGVLGFLLCFGVSVLIMSLIRHCAQPIQPHNAPKKEKGRKDDDEA